MLATSRARGVVGVDSKLPLTEAGYLVELAVNLLDHFPCVRAHAEHKQGAEAVGHCDAY